MKQLDIISIPDTQRELGCSRDWIYKLIKRHNLQVRHIGRKPYLNVKEIYELLETKKASN